ncbi:6-pyruvoyltetrahydropterin/6-carboxytetrahydropterin synthase [Granulicella rosea]|uniref:6-carboxy-5,6,7,8-tetrahydropterin synthase n=1 Tax=Granulicella rosea TaxID=474952 RepID=A0A239IX39_9BACT|nr:6-carboxytetrahydropterin synthase [Granulicella rosea]SNS98119.1 6-pyruvoyltetrahydropterin/6-carboxytetrahydropterin synthase [Granulicella rosea]
MKAHLTRRYHFSASHRLHSDAYTAEENQAVFGKCNNPHGHGHNYVVAVTLAGEIDPATGMVCNLGDLDAFAREHLLARFDHMNLNTLEPFLTLVPTTENLTIEVNRIFQDFPFARLERVVVEETGNNSFVFGG